jgi:hypothetical protein
MDLKTAARDEYSAFRLPRMRDERRPVCRHRWH